MTIDVFGLILIIAAIAGLIMIVGGIALLWKGAITLAAAKDGDAMSLEFRKMFKFTTQVPGLAFFAIGTILLLGAPLIEKTVYVTPVELTGLAKDVDGPITVMVSKNWPVATFTDGEIQDVFYPDTSQLQLEIVASGYKPYSAPLDLSKGRKIPLGTLRLTKAIAKIDPNPSKIAPADFAIPPINDKGTFGASQ